MRIVTYCFALGVAAMLLQGCIEKKPGPAELIGRGIDQMAQGVQDMSAHENYAGRADSERAAARRDSDREFRYDDSRAERDWNEESDSDPYYDPNDPNDRERYKRERDRSQDQRRY